MLLQFTRWGERWICVSQGGRATCPVLAYPCHYLLALGDRTPNVRGPRRSPWSVPSRGIDDLIPFFALKQNEIISYCPRVKEVQFLNCMSPLCVYVSDLCGGGGLGLSLYVRM